MNSDRIASFPQAIFVVLRIVAWVNEEMIDLLVS